MKRLKIDFRSSFFNVYEPTLKFFGLDNKDRKLNPIFNLSEEIGIMFDRYNSAIENGPN